MERRLGFKIRGSLNIDENVKYPYHDSPQKRENRSSISHSPRDDRPRMAEVGPMQDRIAGRFPVLYRLLVGRWPVPVVTVG